MNLRELESKVATTSLKSDGDPKEMKAVAFVEQTIPAYQRFWKLYVFPYRDDKNGAFLNLKLPRDHEAMCIYNYSIFRTAYRVDQLLSNATEYYNEKNEITTEQFDDCIIYIKIGYTQMKHFFGATYSCFQKLKLSILINEWETIWDIFDSWENHKRLFDEIKGEDGKIRKYRNYIVHAAKFPGSGNKVVKPEYIDKMIYWSDFHKNQTPEKLIDRYDFVKKAAEKFFMLTNKLWKSLYNKNMEVNGDNPPINEDMIQKRIMSSDANTNKVDPMLNEESGSLGRSHLNPPTTPSGWTGTISISPPDSS